MSVSRVRLIFLLVLCAALPACNTQREKRARAVPKVTVAAISLQDVTVTQEFSCQLKSQRRIDIRTPVEGIVKAIEAKDGQRVMRDDVLFEIKFPSDLKSDSEIPDPVYPITAPFDGVIGQLQYSSGSRVKRGEVLTTLSENSSMSAFFNVPEAAYLDFQSAKLGQRQDDMTIALVLDGGGQYDHAGQLTAIESEFNRQTGSIRFRVDFPNPDGRLQNGQSGTVQIQQVEHDVIVIPRQATFEILEKRYVYVIDDQHRAHERVVLVRNELDDRFVIKSGLEPGDKVVVDGVRRLRNGEQVEYEDPQPKKALADGKRE